MVPSTYENGKLFNVLPSGNRAPDSTDQNSGYDQTRADFDFDRQGSNLGATRRNSSGLIEKGRENVLVQSNAFDTTWVNQLGTGTITSGQSGYDGSNDAWDITKDTSTFRSVRQAINASGVLTYSAYIKAGTLTSTTLRTDTTAGATQVTFDLTDGSSTLVGGLAISHDSVDIGGGWYRCVVRVNATITNVHIYVDRDGTTAGSIFIQSAQLESGTIATDYIDSGATTGKAGILADMPRINYDANGENGSLLLEGLRSNILENSEYFGGYNLGSGVTINQNYSNSPEGYKNATKLNLTTSANIGVEKPVSGFFESQTHTISVWARCASGTETFRLKCTHASVLDYFSNNFTATTEWQRFDFSKAFTSTTGTGIVAGVVNGTDAQARSIEIYGLQLETNASYPSSYIPTHGAAVSRSADSCYATDIANAIGQGEGTIYIETIPADDSTSYTERLIQFESAGSDFMTLQRFSNSSITFYGTDGTNTWTIQGTNVFTGGEVTKIAAAYKVDDVALYANGTQLSTDTSVATMPNCDRVWFANNSSGSLLYVGSHLKVILFNERLTNAELAALTA